MASQIAKLFIRGKIVNKTAKGLRPEELEEVGRVCQMIYNDRRLAGARTEFCAALGRTIGSEYKDQDFAQQEAWISFWISAVDVLHHRPKKQLKRLLNATCRSCKNICLNRAGEPDDKVSCSCGSKTKFEDKFEIHPTDGTSDKKTEIWSIIDFNTDEAERQYAAATGNEIPERDTSIIENPKQRKKFFQTCLFNYLRQILRENARQQTKLSMSISGPADEIASSVIKSIITNSKQKHEMQFTTGTAKSTYHINTWLMTLEDINQLDDLRQLMKQYNIIIASDDEQITITKEGKIPVVSATIYDNVFIHHVSLDSFRDNDEQDNFRDHIESKTDQSNEVLTYNDIDLCDSAKVVRNRLCETGQRIFDLITCTPESYSKRFGNGKHCKAHISKFLNLSPKEVSRQFKVIEMQMSAVGLVP